MDFTQLRTLVSVADTGSFSAAAEALNCVQSNITGRIKRLEAHLGRPLFERGRGGAKLTPFGRAAYERAVAVLRAAERAERELLDLADNAAPLRLGAMETTAAARLPTLLKELRKRCPKAAISLQTGPTGALLSRLLEQEIDAAFVAAPVDPDRFSAIPAFVEKLRLVRPQDPGEGRALLAFARGCSYRSMAETWLREQGRLDADLIEMGTLDGIIGCVEAGIGFAIAPEAALAAFAGREGLVFEDLPPPLDRVETVLAVRRDHQPTEALRVLREIIGKTT